MSDLYKHRYKCTTCGTVEETVFRETVLTECPTDSGHNLEEITFVEIRYETAPTNVDGRPVGHDTPRYLGTYSYFTGAGDDQSDPHAVGGGTDDLIWNHVASTVNVTNIARASNIATIETSSAHGLSTGYIVDINAVDNTFDAISVPITVVDATHFTYANTGDDSGEASDAGTTSGDKREIMYCDFNTINNHTYVRQGDLQWKDAVQDYMNFELVPKTTETSAGSSTNYNLYGGYLVIPAAGDGTLVVAAEDMVLVQNCPNEFGNLPAGYWDATWNTSTKVFDDIVAAPNGDGEFNMFAAEVVLFRFINRRRFMGTSHKDCKTNDISQLGHGVRIKATVFTDGADHAWSGSATMMLYRQKTC